MRTFSDINDKFDYVEQEVVPAICKLRPKWTWEYPGFLALNGALRNIVVATPFHCGFECIPIEVHGFDGEIICADHVTYDVTGDPAQDAERYIKAMTEWLHAYIQKHGGGCE
jgi:hypothetical protein